MIEMSRLFRASEEIDEAGFRVMSDAIGLSPEKIQMLGELPPGYLKDLRASYVLPILKYHTRFKNVTKDDFLM